MRFIVISKIFLVITLPIILFLIITDTLALNDHFYKKTVLKGNVQNASGLHYEIINFIRSRNAELPGRLTEGEKQHLADVKNLIKISTILLYGLIVSFSLVITATLMTLKVNEQRINFTGKVLFFGGILTIIPAGFLFLLIYSDFSSTFENFHQLLFKKETYLFNPSSALIQLYPEQLFVDLGIKISQGVLAASAIIALLGIILILKSKSKKIKNIGQ